jgi:hypothetical protein
MTRDDIIAIVAAITLAIALPVAGAAAALILMPIERAQSAEQRYLLNYQITFPNGDSLGGNLPFQNYWDCTLVYEHLRSVEEMGSGYTIEYRDICRRIAA